MSALDTVADTLCVVKCHVPHCDNVAVTWSKFGGELRPCCEDHKFELKVEVDNS